MNEYRLSAFHKKEYGREWVQSRPFNAASRFASIRIRSAIFKHIWARYDCALLFVRSLRGILGRFCGNDVPEIVLVMSFICDRWWALCTIFVVERKSGEKNIFLRCECERFECFLFTSKQMNEQCCPGRIFGLNRFGYNAMNNVNAKTISAVKLYTIILIFLNLCKHLNIL